VPVEKPRPTVAITGVEPARPRAGDTLVIRLAGQAEPGTTLRYEYRRSPAGAWQRAADGRIVIPDLPGGDFALEIRALDGERVSEVIRRTWTVPGRLEVDKKPPPEPARKEHFFQSVVVRRVSGYSVLETEFRHAAQYGIVSRFDVDRQTSEGGLEVRQRVEAVQLSDADPSLQAELNTLLQKIKGATFQLTLDAQGQVVRFEGDPGALKVLGGGNLLGGQSYVLWSFLDRDGWKELAQLAFFQPQKPLERGQRWTRPMTHHWGPLGDWAGKTAYVHVGRAMGHERIDYVHDLQYRPPMGGGGGGLPFEIGRAQFRLGEAAGNILFDAERRRVAAAEERFRVRGQVPVMALGVAVVINMEELQVFQVQIHDRLPTGGAGK